MVSCTSEVDRIGAIDPHTPKRSGDAVLKVEIALPIFAGEAGHNCLVLLPVRSGAIQRRIGVLRRIKEYEPNPVTPAQFADPFKRADVDRQWAAAEGALGRRSNLEQSHPHKIEKVE